MSVCFEAWSSELRQLLLPYLFRDDLSSSSCYFIAIMNLMMCSVRFGHACGRSDTVKTPADAEKHVRHRSPRPCKRRLPRYKPPHATIRHPQFLHLELYHYFYLRVFFYTTSGNMPRTADSEDRNKRTSLLDIVRFFGGGIFTPDPSTYDPIAILLSTEDDKERDELTTRWRDNKLQELNFIGVVVSFSAITILPGVGCSSYTTTHGSRHMTNHAASLPFSQVSLHPPAAGLTFCPTAKPPHGLSAHLGTAASSSPYSASCVRPTKQCGSIACLLIATAPQIFVISSPRMGTPIQCAAGRVARKF